MKRVVLACIVITLTSSIADAGPLRRVFSPAAVPAPPAEPRFPRIAKLMEPPPYITNPGPLANNPNLRLAGRVALASMTLANSDALSAIGVAGPRAIRLGRVIFFGSPMPGRPWLTAAWIASPGAVRIGYWIKQRRGTAIDYSTPTDAAPMYVPCCGQ
jgi:hypothetical protein